MKVIGFLVGQHGNDHFRGKFLLCLVRRSHFCGFGHTKYCSWLSRGWELWGQPPHTHTLNASQLICLLCHDFYPMLEVSHTWKGSHNHPLTLRNQNQPAWTQGKRHSTNKFCKAFCGIKQVPPVLLHGIGGDK